MTKEEHIERHKSLHGHLDELVADWIRHTGNLPSENSVMSLMEWSFTQTVKPTEE